MNVWIGYVLPILSSIFIYACELYGMWRMGTDRQIRPWVRKTIEIVYITVAIVCSLLGSGLINAVLLMGIPLLGNRIYHSGKKHFFYYLILAVAVFLTDGLVNVVLQTGMYFGILYFNSMGLMVLMHIVSTRLTEYMVISLIVLIVLRKNSSYPISKKQFFRALILPLFSLVNVYTMLYCIQVFMTDTMLLLFLVNLLLLISINIYFTVLFDTIGKNQYLENELNLHRQQAKMQWDYYESEEKKYEESRKLIHDIRNHMETMEQLYRSNDAADAAEYAENIHNMLNQFGQQYYTSDKLLNIILNDKVKRMQRKDIFYDIKIGEIDISFMQEVDITALFANIIDNAIESAAKADCKKIKLRVKMVQGFVSIRLENTSKKEPRKEKGYYMTEKTGHHGIGLKNVSRVVLAYDGDMDFEWKEGIFYTNILLVRGKSC